MSTGNKSYELREVLVNVSGVDFYRESTPILRDLNLVVRDIVRPNMEQGQVGALLGPSGVGKTSLFRLLAGLEKPNKGTITLANNKPVERGMVGVVSQNYQLFNHRTVQSNLLIGAQMGGYSASEAQSLTKQYLERFALHEHADKYPAQLSGGQRQRTAIAQQLLCSDGLLLMDEPFSGLDMLAVRKVIRLIQAVAQADELKTFIIVTHDIHAAFQVADTVWLMGRDRKPSGEVIPGARVQETYNLIDRGLAWEEESQAETGAYRDLVREVEARFETL